MSGKNPPGTSTYTPSNKNPFAYDKWSIFCICVTAFVVACAMAVSIAVIVITADGMAMQRCALFGMGSNFTAIGQGMLIMDSAQGTIQWTIQYTNVLNNLLAIYINGPIPPGITDGPLDIALCGSPSTLACDLTTPGYIQYKLYSYNGNSLKTYIDGIRSYPVGFYVNMIFDVGEMRFPLCLSAGT